MIRFTLDTRQLEKDLSDLAKRQIPFAVSSALNATAKEVQVATRAGIARRFTLRSSRFVLNTVKINRGDFATKDNLRAIVTVGGSVGGRRQDLLVKFEDGGVRRSSDPGRPIAIPSDYLRPTKSAVIPKGMYPKALRLISSRTASGSTLAPKTHMTRRGVEQIKGKRRTFVLDPRHHRGARSWAVFQRQGPHSTDVQLLWIYKTSIKIPRKLFFKDTAAKVVRRRMVPNLIAAFDRAIRTAR